MLLDDLIDELEAVRCKHGNLPVVMTTQSGSGEVDRVVVEFDMIENRKEVLLVEGT